MNRNFWHIVRIVDAHLDEKVGYKYQKEPFAQDWARIAKIAEELGETISELISWTGQNPRKGETPEAYEKMIKELADTVLTGIYALQHFTKNENLTEHTIVMQAIFHAQRMNLI